MTLFVLGIFLVLNLILWFLKQIACVSVFFSRRRRHYIRCYAVDCFIAEYVATL